MTNCCSNKNLLILADNFSDKVSIVSDNNTEGFMAENMLLSGNENYYKSSELNANSSVNFLINHCSENTVADTLVLNFRHLLQGIRVKICQYKTKAAYKNVTINKLANVTSTINYASKLGLVNNFSGGVICANNIKSGIADTYSKCVEVSLDNEKFGGTQTSCGYGLQGDECNANNIVIIPLNKGCEQDNACYNYTNIEFIMPDNTEHNILEINRLILGKAFRPKCNFAVGASLAWVDDSITERTISGRKVTSCTKPYRRFKGSLQCLNEQEAFDFLFHLDGANGKRGEYLISIDPDNENLDRFKQWTFFASSSQLGEVTFEGSNYFSKPFVFEENI